MQKHKFDQKSNLQKKESVGQDKLIEDSNDSLWQQFVGSSYTDIPLIGKGNVLICWSVTIKFLNSSRPTAKNFVLLNLFVQAVF